MVAYPLTLINQPPIRDWFTLITHPVVRNTNQMNTQHKDTTNPGSEATDARETADSSAVPESIDEVSAEALAEAAEQVVEEQLAEAESSEEDQLPSELEAARAEVEELKDNALRVRAEMENIRRRAQNEVVSARKFAIEGFAQELLNVKDSLDQAALVELSDNESEAVVKMQEGLALTLKQLDSVLGKFSVNEVEAGEGVKFDPELHQAISMVASDTVDSDHIISVMQKGFTLKERLLRPAMVVVAS